MILLVQRTCSNCLLCADFCTGAIVCQTCHKPACGETCRATRDQCKACAAKCCETCGEPDATSRPCGGVVCEGFDCTREHMRQCGDCMADMREGMAEACADARSDR